MKELTNQVIREDEKFASSLRPALEVSVPAHLTAAIHEAAVAAAEKKASRFRRYFRPRVFHFIATTAAAVTICTYSISQHKENQKEAIRAANIERANCIIDLASISMPDDVAEESEYYYYDLLASDDNDDSEDSGISETGTIESMAGRLEQILAH